MRNMSFNQNQAINIYCHDIVLKGILNVPKEAIGIVLFAHGSASSHLSPRNQFVATILQQAKIATLLFDLLTPDEEVIDQDTMEFRFDIEFLATRLLGATYWLSDIPFLKSLNIGYFGASTGAAAALLAAAQTKEIKAIVSRGGRPDLAGNILSSITTPTLLIVGGEDELVIELNKQAYSQLTCTKQIEVISGATHLFEEPGALEHVAQLATNWFKQYLPIAT